jgi:hypothetical protein
MALLFSANSDLVNCGDASPLQNLNTCSIIGWVKLTSTNPIGRVASKGLAGSGFRYLSLASQAGNPVVQASVNRATTPLQVDGDLANFSVTFNAGDSVCVAGVWNTAGSATDGKVFAGNLTTPLHEPSAYRTQNLGTGATVSNIGQNQIIGNRSSGSATLDAAISWVGIWNRVLSVEELIAQQWHPHVTSGCVGFWMLGYNGTGTQPDWSGNAGNGSVTGCAVATHVPLRAPFGGFAGWRGAYTAPAPAAGQPLVKRYSGIPHMRRGSVTFGHGWSA